MCLVCQSSGKLLLLGLRYEILELGILEASKCTRPGPYSRICPAQVSSQSSMSDNDHIHSRQIEIDQVSVIATVIDRRIYSSFLCDTLKKLLQSCGKDLGQRINTPQHHVILEWERIKIPLHS